MPEITSEECYKKHDELSKLLTDIQIGIAELPEKILDKSEKKFASKITEKIVFAMVGVICLAVITALIGTVVSAFN